MSDAFTECVLDIIVSTGVVSNLVTHTEYYYNSSLAHCFYNASMVLPSAHAHLHGEVVSFGNLVLLAYDGQDELLERFLDFNTSIGLPVTLAQVGITTDEQLMKLVSAAEHIKEWSTVPNPPCANSSSPPSARSTPSAPHALPPRPNCPEIQT